tara:strand:+ start:239 stop:610 length:372 start_codon:yes stop_codon:yes gene_type:complete
MSKALSDMMDKMSKADKKIERFADILEQLSSTEEKKKLLWKEIYENALLDRENASLLFTDAWKQMSGGASEHVTLGSVMSKYLERMCKSNEQILRLAELIAKAQDTEEKIDPNELFEKIGSGE